MRATIVSGTGARSVRFTAVAGKTYTVQYKALLTDSIWLKLTDVSAQAATGEIEVQDSTFAGQLQRFYRVITPPQP